MSEKVLWENPSPPKHKKGRSSDVQAVYFFINEGEGREENEWTIDEAWDWIEEHPEFEPMKAEQKGRQLRFRIRDPRQFDRFITKIVGRGIHLVIGFYGPDKREALPLATSQWDN